MEILSVYKDVKSDFYDQQLRSKNPFRRWFHFNRYRVINSFIKSYYNPGLRIVDMGAGSCAWNKDRLPVYGVDCNEKLLIFGKDKNRLMQYKVAPLHDTGFASNFFDIMVGAEILEHMEDVDIVLQEAYRILNKNGIFAISVPYNKKFGLWNPLFALQIIYHGYIKDNDYYKNRCGHVKYFSPAYLNDALKRNGFEIELQFTVLKFSIFTIARKGGGLSQLRSNYSDLTIIVPVKNEILNIAEILKDLTQYYPGAKIIVPDDELTDLTTKAIESISHENKNIEILDRKNEKIKGLTASVLDAIDQVKTKYFIVTDGYGQHPIKAVNKIYNQLKINTSLSVVSRVGVSGWCWNKRLLFSLGSFLGKTILFVRKKRIPVDILSGYFGGETAYWKKVAGNKRNCFSLAGHKVLFDFLKLRDSEGTFDCVYENFNARPLDSSKISCKLNRNI
ncbi:MAG: glycosyltransferase [Candidatus Omnitrophica bacterium]|nr:glycosyltransferase [Candidatus Omnitrophota bacterium]